VLELGAWTGLTTRAIASLAPHVRIVAADRWGDETRRRDAVETFPESVFERFVANCWSCRDRVTPLCMSPRRALEAVRASGPAPDVIYVQCSHTRSLGSDIRLARELFPGAALVGDNWQWPRVQRAVEAVVENDFVALEVAGNMWRVWSDWPSFARVSGDSRADETDRSPEEAASSA
jgi:hypothetical protein